MASPSKPLPAGDTITERRTARVFRQALSVQSFYILFLGLLPGFVLVFASILLGISTLTAHALKFAPVDREVGYMPALNWSLTYALLFPLALYLMNDALQRVADALGSLHSRGMVRDSQMRIIADPMLPNSWVQGTGVRNLLLWVFAISLPALYSFVEWGSNNLARLVGHGPAAQYPDYDWGLAGIMADPNWSFAGRMANAAFDLLAFSTEFLLVASSFAFFLLLLDLGRVLPGLAHGTDYTLVPDLRPATDSRRGFEEFARALEEMLGVALLGYLICYAVRLQGLYMASSKARSLAEFVQTDIWAGVTQAADPKKGPTLGDILSHLFTLGDYTTRGMLAWLMAILIFAFSLLVVVISVRGAAERAKANAEAYLRGVGAGSLFGGDARTELDRAQSMTLWPLGYLKLNWILVTMGGAVVTLYFYRIGLFVAGFVIAALLLKLLYRVVKQ